MADTEELKRLLSEATPGQWTVAPADSMLEIRQPEPLLPPIVKWMGFDESDRPNKKHRANAALIVAAVNSLPALLARIESLEGKLEEIRTLCKAEHPFVEIPKVIVRLPLDILAIINRSQP